MRAMIAGMVAGWVALGSPGGVGAQDAAPAGEQAVAAAVGYADVDGDGSNDLFRDANGDGVCDVTGKAYGHRYGFADVDGDRVNDLFRDADGDGVNDLDGAWVDANGDGVCDNVLDADGDGRNDITGEPYNDDLGGRRFGRIDEEAGEQVAHFVDEDGDGMHDAWARDGGVAGMDLFIDEDGDGIADGRTVRGRMGAGWEGEQMLGRRGPGAPGMGAAGEDEEGEKGHHRRHGAQHRQ